MSEDPEQVLISSELVASSQKTKASFKEGNIKIEASAKDPKLLIFSTHYSWWEEMDNMLNDWDFYMTISDDKGAIIHSEYKHFGEDEPGFIGKNEEAYKEYIKEESYLRAYRSDEELRKGEGTMARSIKTPDKPGTYTYNCLVVSQFWARRLGEEKGLEKNKTEDSAKCTVVVKVR